MIFWDSRDIIQVAKEIWVKKIKMVILVSENFEIRKNNRVRDPANYLHRVQKMRLAHKH